MYVFNQSFETPAENLACDEALLEMSESGADREVLRLWRPQQPFVVLGYSSAAKNEVNLAACRRLGIPILRRCSGGCTVLQSPGCLNFSLILRIAAGPLESIAGTTHWILGRHQALFEALTQKPVTLEGISDLAIAARKFSGHAQRRRRHFLLFHGSILLDADFRLMESVLLMPSRTPAYRQHRSHSRFLTNLKLGADKVAAALQKAWEATEAFERLPADPFERLLRTRYTIKAWNYRF